MIATAPDGVNGDKETMFGNVWSDRKDAEERGKITAISIMKGDYIDRIQTR